MDRGLEREILETLAAHGQLSVSGLADALDRNPVTVDRQCYDLQTDGYIVIAASDGTYELTSKGRTRLEETTDERSPIAPVFETLSDGAHPPTGMTVDDEEVRHVASLARIDLDDEEIERFTEQFGEILEYFEALDEAPETESEAELANVMRPDEVREGLTQKEALRNAPETEDGYFKGPNVS
jgi:aspartyl-tRNA(Asn)/glutamyl-tRNA(Gln) amidotransferase subunit C